MKTIFLSFLCLYKFSTLVLNLVQYLGIYDFFLKKIRGEKKHELKPTLSCFCFCKLIQLNFTEILFSQNRRIINLCCAVHISWARTFRRLFSKRCTFGSKRGIKSSARRNQAKFAKTVPKHLKVCLIWLIKLKKNKLMSSYIFIYSHNSIVSFQ